MVRTIGKILRLLDGQPTGRRGQSMVEMALTAPILILMVLGLTEVGFLANNYLILQDAVRAGGRAAVNLDPTTWKYGEARNQQRMDCDTLDNWYVLLPSTENTIGYGARQKGTDAPRGENLRRAGLGYSSGSDSEFGFFDEVACQVVNGMLPLKYNDDDSVDGQGTTTSKDDVVVSAVSYSRMQFNTPNGVSVVPGPDYASGPGSHGDTWVTVTGRWPLENRFCAESDQNSRWISGDSRDPFNYMTSNINQSWKNNSFNDGTSADPGEGIHYDASGTFDPNKTFILDVAKAKAIGSSNGSSANNNQGVRGFVFSGHAKNNGAARTPAADSCYGSSFRVQDIEAKLNLDATFNPSVPNGGLVIVEIFWQHHPLVFGPLFEGFTNDRTRDPVLHIWGWFPVSSAESTATPSGG